MNKLMKISILLTAIIFLSPLAFHFSTVFVLGDTDPNPHKNIEHAYTHMTDDVYFILSLANKQDRSLNEDELETINHQKWYVDNKKDKLNKEEYELMAEVSKMSDLYIEGSDQFEKHLKRLQSY